MTIKNLSTKYIDFSNIFIVCVDECNPMNGLCPNAHRSKQKAKN